MESVGADVVLEADEVVVWLRGAARNSPKGSDESDAAVLHDVSEKYLLLNI